MGFFLVMSFRVMPVSSLSREEAQSQAMRDAKHDATNKMLCDNLSTNCTSKLFETPDSNGDIVLWKGEEN